MIIRVDRSNPGGVGGGGGWGWVGGWSRARPLDENPWWISLPRSLPALCGSQKYKVAQQAPPVVVIALFLGFKFLAFEESVEGG